MKSKIPMKEKTGQVDFLLLILIMVIALFGFVMLFSASSPKAAEGGIIRTLIKQGGNLAIGVLALLIGANWDYHIYARHYKKIIIIAIAVMAIVPMFGIVSHGATRQISLGFISFQPSEFAKYALVLYYATFLSRPETQNISTNVKNMKTATLVLIILCFTCLLQRHLSAMLVIGFIGASMLIIGGLSKRLITIGAGGLGAVIIVAISMAGYRMDRIKAYIDPFKYKQGIGWQIIQSLFAVGSGGLFGLGLGQSRQKYRYLPEAQNDYIYAVVCEELGFIGGVAVILLFALFVWRGMSIALKSRDKMGMYTAFGICCIVGIQVLINIGVVLSLIPSTGMQLPLFSSGGSSMIATMWGMGILLNISKTSRIKKL